MITSDYGRSASDTPHPRTPAAQLQLAGVSATSSRIGAVQVSAWVHTASPHRRCAQVPTPINFDDPDKRVLALVKAFLKAGILCEDGTESDTDTGTPQGGILSPVLANVALSVLDEHFADSG